MEKEKNYITISQLALADDCCGCGACVSVCPKKCISLQLNAKGFYNPVMSEECVKCSKCVKACQILNRVNSDDPKSCYACKSESDDIRMRSSSGGLFYEICRAFREMYGDESIFCGAVFDEKLDVIHALRDFKDIEALMGSKYVQSRMGDSYFQIGEKLKLGKHVLFSGTGCQCGGLINYLTCTGISSDNLMIVDIICHGVPSLRIWHDYLEELEKRAGKRIVSFQFRNKNVAWRGINPVIRFEDGTKMENDEFVNSFRRLYGNLSLNEVCHKCSYAAMKRCGDMTIGDYWGVEKYMPEMDDNKGVSLCLINSEKGIRLLDAMSRRIHCSSLRADQAMQPQLRGATERNVRHTFFWRDYEKKGYTYVAQKYVSDSAVHNALRAFYHKIQG